MKHMTIFAAVGLTLAVTLPASSAEAQNTRSFVSPTGSDSNPCSLAAPCRNFQRAHDATNSGGEIAVLGTAGYGTLTITKAISVVNPGWFEAAVAVPSSGTGIVINAQPGDAVSLRGLTINGGGVGTNGIVFNSGGTLTVDNCVIQNFHYNYNAFRTGNGILIQPTSGTMSFAITNTNVSNNGDISVFFYPQSGPSNATGIIDHVVGTGNDTAVVLNTYYQSGGTVSAAISNLVGSNNTQDGIYIQNGAGVLRVSIDNANLSGNGNYGIDTFSNPKILLGRSTIVNNAFYGVSNNTSPNAFYTYNDNHLDLNGQGDVTGTALISLSPG